MAPAKRREKKMAAAKAAYMMWRKAERGVSMRKARTWRYLICASKGKNFWRKEVGGENARNSEYQIYSR